MLQQTWTAQRLLALNASVGLLLAFILVAESPVSAQTVQLPSFSRFSYSGSVLVPVQGSTSLGSVSRSYSGRSGRGHFGGRAVGAGMSHAGASVRATMIDHDAIDRQLRGLPPRNSTLPAQAAGTPNRQAKQPGETLPQPPASPQTSEVQKPDPDAEGKALVRYARRQYQAGKHEAAYGAYQLARSKLSPRLAELARLEMQRVFGDRP